MAFSFYLGMVYNVSPSQWLVVLCPVDPDSMILLSNNTPQCDILTQENFMTFWVFYYLWFGITLVYE